MHSILTNSAPTQFRAPADTAGALNAPARMSRKLQDAFFKRAKAEGYLARSAYKLLELQKQHQIIPSGVTELILKDPIGRYVCSLLIAYILQTATCWTLAAPLELGFRLLLRAPAARLLAST